jgi:membrane protease subunit HflC
MSLYFALVFLIVLFFLARLKTVTMFAFVLLLILIFYSATFIVNEGSQVVITQFGRIIGSPYKEAGLYFKIPFFWKANYFDKRIFIEEILQADVVTKDAYFVTVDTVVNWRIVDPELFFQNMNNLADARELLKNIVSGSVREAITKYELVKTLPSSNLTLNRYNSNIPINPAIESPQQGLQRSVTFARRKLTRMMAASNYDYTLDYGMEIVGVLIRYIGYGPVVEHSINERMILEQLTKAEELRSSGRKYYQSTLGDIEKKKQVILAPAKREAELIKGRADAKATKIYAQAYGKNPEFYNFWRTLIAYEIGIPPKSQGAILSTDNDFLKLLNGGRVSNEPAKESSNKPVTR